MNEEQKPRKKLSRRAFLRLGMGGGGALILTAVGALARADQLRQAMGLPAADTRPVIPRPLAVETVIDSTTIHLGATDGFLRLPADPADYPEGYREIYGFGFVSADDPVDDIDEFIRDNKGKVQWPSPILAVDEVHSGPDSPPPIFLILTNLGLVVRFDLDDSHTIHWHGFRNPTAVFDGVPEVSIAVPVGRNFPYYYKPEDPGTYMYHCHFEDTEHVQMGMTGIVFVRPKQNIIGSGTVGPGKYLYNDVDGATRYDREYTLLLNEVDTRPHDYLENVQEFVWSSYKANYWLINGRAYPDTVKANIDSSLPYQPVSSLIQAVEGEAIALRLASLGYEQHDMEMQIPVSAPGSGYQGLQVVGHDATYLGPYANNGAPKSDNRYMTNIIYIGPGEARDALFTAPPFNPATVAGTHPSYGDYNRYYFKNRNLHKQSNNGMSGLGGMVTEVHVYASSSGLPAQTEANELF